MTPEPSSTSTTTPMSERTRALYLECASGFTPSARVDDPEVVYLNNARLELEQWAHVMSVYDPNTGLTRGPKADRQFPAHQKHPDAADESRKAWYTVPRAGRSHLHAPWHLYNRFAWGPINQLISPMYSHPLAALAPREAELHELYGLG